VTPLSLSFSVLSNPAVIGLDIGATLSDIRNTFKSLNSMIGHSYTNGPLFRIAAYELSELGILGAELAFNRNDCLDALYFQFEKVQYPYLLEYLRNAFTWVSQRDSLQGNFIAIFSNGPIEITLDPQRPGSSCFLSYTSPAFKRAREAYTCAINNSDLLPCTS
jgi:hypothetical protein